MKIAIIGAGIHGLMCAFQLVQKGLKNLTLIEQFSFGHTRSSSHGTSRIFRRIYDKSCYVTFADRAGHMDWPELEKEFVITMIKIIMHPFNWDVSRFGRG